MPIPQITRHKLVAILRGVNPADTIDIVEALYAGGIRVVEITMNSEEPLSVIRAVSKHFGDTITIGAGTVLNPENVRKAVDAGAKFILSPNVNEGVIKTTKDLGMVSVPGAYTATEMVNAWEMGGDIIKIFPASSPAYLKNLAGPLPHIPLLPTGGITLDNIAEFNQTGAIGFGIGSALVDGKTAVTPAYLAQLTVKARQFIVALNP